jgi:outer membrane protein assembly factor BamB
MRTYALCLACWLVTAAVQAGDWPGWRGPGGLGISDEKALPVKWSATQNVLWKVPLPGAGLSAPVVWGDRVFLTASDGRASDRLHVLCFDRNDGRTVWHTRLFGSASSEGEYPAGGMAVPTPATDGRRLYAVFGTGDLIALDCDGRPVWIRSLAQEYGPFRNRWGMAASPLLLDDLLVILVDHWGQSYLLGVDPKTGANRWKTNRDAAVNWSSPLAVTVNGRTQIVVTGTNHVCGYDARSGQELWKVAGMQEQCIPSPVARGGTVYAVSGRKGMTLAIDLHDAKPAVRWKSKRGAPYIPSPVCYGPYYYLLEDEGFGTCLDAATGAEVWRERLGGHYQASPLAAAGRLYYTNLDGVITVVQAGPKFQVLAKNDLGESIAASPAPAHGRLFIRGEKHLFCVGAK